MAYPNCLSVKIVAKQFDHENENEIQFIYIYRNWILTDNQGFAHVTTSFRKQMKGKLTNSISRDVFVLVQIYTKFYIYIIFIWKLFSPQLTISCSFVFMFGQPKPTQINDHSHDKYKSKSISMPYSLLLSPCCLTLAFGSKKPQNLMKR